MAGEKKENPQSDMIADGSKGGGGVKSLPGSIFRSWKIGSVINIRIPHGKPKTPPLLEEKMGGYGLGGWLSSKENVL